MKYYKTLIILLLFFLISSISYAKDAEKLEVEFEQTKRIQIEGITKFAIVNPEIVTAKLVGNILSVTGVKYGTTSLFIWKNNEIIPYVIYAVAPKNIIKYNNNLIVYDINYNQPYGYYRLFSSIYQIGNNSNQNLNHQLYYKIPFFNGFLTFNGNFNNAFLDLKDIQSLDINNLQLMFNSKDFSFNIGDISNQFNSSLVQLRGTQIKGASFQYTNDRARANVFAGVESNPITIFSKNNIQSTNNLSGGFYGSYSALDNLLISTNYNIRLLKNNSAEPNILGSVRWTPLNTLYLGTDVATDFKGNIAYNLNSSFYYGWAKTKEYLRFNAITSHFDKNYSNGYIKDRTTYLANVSFRHRSGADLSASAGRFEQSGLINDNLSLKASKVFEKYYNISGEIDYNNSLLDTNTRYSLTTEITNFIPINLNYSYAQGLRGDLFNEHSISGSVNLFETDYLRNIFSTSVRYNNSSYLANDNSSLLANFNLGLYYSGIKKVNLAANLSYGRYTPNLKKTFVNNSYALSLSGGWDISVYNKINLSIGITKDDLNSFNTYSNIGYTYYFGKAIDDAYTVGNIKGVVFDDANNNNILDNDEKIIPDVKLKIGDKSASTDSKGYLLSGIDYGAYEVIIDKDSLPNGYRMTSNVIETVTLNSKTKDYNIPLRYESVIKGYIYAGKESGSGLPDIKITIDDKDTITTDSEGYYYLSVKPGKHILKLDYTTIPSGYTFNQSLTKEIETGKEDTELNFIFTPVRIIKIQAYETTSLSQTYNQDMKPVKDLEVEIIYPDGRLETLKTDEDGIISLENLETGIIEIKSKYLKESIKVEVPEDKFQKEINIPVIK